MKHINLPGHSSSCAASNSHLSIDTAPPFGRDAGARLPSTAFRNRCRSRGRPLALVEHVFLKRKWTKNIKKWWKMWKIYEYVSRKLHIFKLRTHVEPCPGYIGPHLFFTKSTRFATCWWLSVVPGTMFHLYINLLRVHNDSQMEIAHAASTRFETLWNWQHVGRVLGASADFGLERIWLFFWLPRKGVRFTNLADLERLKRYQEVPSAPSGNLEV